jgi:anti-anti-sigma factor
MEAATERDHEAAGRWTPRGVRRPSTLLFAGALDAYTVRDALLRIDAVVESAPRELVVDLGDVTRIDSFGVHALVTLHKRVTAQGGKVVFVNAGGQPLMVLDLVGFQKAIAR